MPQRVNIDALRSVVYTSITGSYAALGAALTVTARLICITNSTDKDMLISTDGTTDMLVIPNASFKLFDLNSNRDLSDPMFAFAIGTQFYVKDRKSVV